MRTAETDLKDIKSMMERSSRFISLSGLAGIFAGSYALIGAWIAYRYFLPTNGLRINFEGISQVAPLILTALAVLVLSVLTAILFTTRNAKKKKQKIWNRPSQLMLWNLAIPLLAGGSFLIILLLQGSIYLIAPAMLIFYGLALVNASKYTLNDIKYLGYCEILLGLLATWFYGHGLLFWGIGFGVLHITYGALMYWKYER